MARKMLSRPFHNLVSFSRWISRSFQAIFPFLRCSEFISNFITCVGYFNHIYFDDTVHSCAVRTSPFLSLAAPSPWRACIMHIRAVEIMMFQKVLFLFNLGVFRVPQIVAPTTYKWYSLLVPYRWNRGDYRFLRLLSVSLSVRLSVSQSVRLSVSPLGDRPLRFPDFSRSCFEIFTWNLVYEFVLM